MKYDRDQIDFSNPEQPIYRLQIDANLPVFSTRDHPEVLRVIEDLRQSLAFLLDDRMTFDAETLLPTVWISDLGSQHNRSIGLILGRMVDGKMVPLVRAPKGSGSRVRFRIQY